MHTKLKLKDLVWIGTGHVVGAGVVSIVGAALAVTGYSIWLAFFVSCVISFFRITPYIFFFSSVSLEGGRYAMITSCVGSNYGGFITIASLLSWAARGTAVLALSQYMFDIFPFDFSKSISIILWAFFCFMNLLGVNMMSKVQSIASPILVFTLTAFSLVAILNTQNGYLDFSSPYMFLNGSQGFFTAVVLLSYSCDGINSIANYSKLSENPTINIPKSMVYISIVTLILYVLVGYSAGAVLPLHLTQNATLTVTAKYILHPLFYILFLILGPIFALITTMNAGIPDSIFPVVAGVKDGWLPKILAKQNKFKAYFVSIIIVFIIGCLPILFNLSIKELTSFTMILSSVSTVLILISAIRFPFVFSNEWKKSKLYINNFFYFILIFIFCVIEIFIVLISLKNLKFTMILINLILLIFAFLYGYYKSKRKKWEILIISHFNFLYDITTIL